jgi:5'-nucleotidase
MDESKKIVYVDMDNTLVDFEWGIRQLDTVTAEEYKNRLDEIPGYFRNLPPLEGAIDAFHKISGEFEAFILSTAPWENPGAWRDKLLWVHTHLPIAAYKRLILSHNKHLNRGDYLIDDRRKNGAEDFQGELILFGSDQFPDWPTVLQYLGIK